MYKGRYKKVKESIKEGKNKIRRLKCKNLEAIEEFLNNKGFQIKEVYEIYIESRLGTTKLDKINIVIEPKSKKVMN